MKPGSSIALLFAPYRHAHALRFLALGFSAGLPLLLVLGTLSFWLREAGIDRATIGHLSWVGLAYGFKWLWAPLVDRLPLPLVGRLGRRRSWLLLAQATIAAGLLAMAALEPQQSLQPFVWLALLVAFASATQDIALDALRIDLAGVSQQAALSACYQTGYRMGMIWAGAGVLWLAARAQTPSSAAHYDALAWQGAYGVMAGSMLVGMVAVLCTPEPLSAPLAPARTMREWFYASAIAPFVDFFSRYRWQALWVLGLIALYRISDIVMGIMANPFYVDMGFSKEEVAAITKLYGVVMTLLGAFVGGALASRMGVLRLLLLGAILSACSNLLFVWLAMRGHDVTALTLVISLDNLAAGLASTAFIAYLSGLTNTHYSATQYALFSSMMLLLPKFIAGFSGDFVNAYGYAPFFAATALLGLPVCLLVWRVGRALSATAPPAPLGAQQPSAPSL